MIPRSCSENRRPRNLFARDFIRLEDWLGEELSVPLLSCGSNQICPFFRILRPRTQTAMSCDGPTVVKFNRDRLHHRREKGLESSGNHREVTIRRGPRLRGRAETEVVHAQQIHRDRVYLFRFPRCEARPLSGPRLIMPAV